MKNILLTAACLMALSTGAANADPIPIWQVAGTWLADGPPPESLPDDVCWLQDCEVQAAECRAQWGYDAAIIRDNEFKQCVPPDVFVPNQNVIPPVITPAPVVTPPVVTPPAPPAPPVTIPVGPQRPQLPQCGAGQMPNLNGGCDPISEIEVDENSNKCEGGYTNLGICTFVAEGVSDIIGNVIGAVGGFIGGVIGAIGGFLGGLFG